MTGHATGRVVIVTGGAAGIGWATARRFAASGDHVVIADLQQAAAVARAGELGAGHLGLGVDVAQKQAVAGMVAATLDRFGRLDVLINNAGQTDPRAMPAVEQELAEFRHLLAVNLHGSFAAGRAAAAAMAGRGGVIVNLASGAGIVAVPLRNAYGAAKRGVIALTRSMAREWAPLGIRVNAVAPGYIATEMVESLVRAGKVDPARVERRVPLGRLGRPEEIAAVVFHLASADAACVTGTLCVADGGYLAFGGTGDASAPGRFAAAPPPGPRVVALAGASGPMAGALSDAFAAQGDIVVRLGSDAIDAAIAEIVRQRGRLDVLVNATAAGGPAVALSAQSPQGFAAQVDACLTGGFVATRAAGREMLAQGFGAIVNLVAAQDVAGRPGHAAAAAGAAGLVMLTRSLACEWGHAVRVNMVAAGQPGSVTPLGRVLRAEDVAGAVRFLAGAEASYVTGSVYTVDGGAAAAGLPAA